VQKNTGVFMKKVAKTDIVIADTLNALNKMIDTLTLKKKHREEDIVKIIFNHLGFTIAYIDGEKELNQIITDIKKDLKVFIKEEKEEEKEEIAFEKAMAKAKKTTKKVAKPTTKKVSKKK